MAVGRAHFRPGKRNKINGYGDIRQLIEEGMGKRNPEITELHIYDDINLFAANSDIKWPLAFGRSKSGKGSPTIEGRGFKQEKRLSSLCGELDFNAFHSKGTITLKVFAFLT